MNEKIQATEDESTNNVDNTDYSISNDEGLKRNFRFRNFFLFIFTISIAILIGYIQISLFNEVHKKGSKEIFKETVDYKLDPNSHKWFIVENFFNKSFLDELELLTKSSVFTTINGETSHLITDVIDSAGEAVPIGHDDCEHPFMAINANRTLCHIPQRIDVGNHFIATGGFNSYMESYEKMLTRILVFHHRIHDLIKKYNIDDYFNKNEKFLSHAKEICKNEFKNFDGIITDLFHFDIVVLIAGQEVPMHLDVPYFMGADRTTLPQWLLVMMKQSKLFDQYYIPDLKGVLWLSEHKNKPDVDGGHFYMYPSYKSDADVLTKEFNQDYIMLESIYNRAILFDGSQIIHGVDRFKPNIVPKLFNRNQRYHVKYDSNEKLWNLYNADGQLIQGYTDDDIQMSLVWRMHCFQNENEKNKFYSHMKTPLSITEIADKFKKDLKSKNKLPAENIKYLDLWTIVIKEYLIYPLNNRSRKYLNFFTFNYCLLPKVMPETVNEYLLDPVLKYVC